MSYQQLAYNAFPQPGQPGSAYQLPDSQPESGYEQQPQVHQPQPNYQQSPSIYRQQQSEYYSPSAQQQPTYAPASQSQTTYVLQPQQNLAPPLDPAFEHLYKRLTTSTPPPVSTFADLYKAAPAAQPSTVEGKPVSNGNPEIAWLDECPFCASRWSILPDGSLVCEAVAEHTISQAAITEWETTGTLPWKQGKEKLKPSMPREETKTNPEAKSLAPSASRVSEKTRRRLAEICRETQEDEPRGIIERAMHGLPYVDDGEEDLEDYAYLANRGGRNMRASGGNYGSVYGGDYGRRGIGGWGGGYGCHYGI